MQPSHRRSCQVLVGINRDFENTPIYEWQGNEELVWRDREGNEYREELTVRENSPLFQLYDGNPVKVRYNPASPTQFYVREEMCYRVNRAARIAALTAAAGCLILLGPRFLLRA